MSEFKAGDVVMIKSGGPRMVVVCGVDEEVSQPQVWVQWFQEDCGEFRGDKVTAVALVKCDDQA